MLTSTGNMWSHFKELLLSADSKTVGLNSIITKYLIGIKK